MKVKVYTKSIELRYFNTFFSKATYFILISSILSIVVPFILVYYAKGFWLKRDTFHEQPDIKYTYEYIFMAQTNKLHLPIFCTNIFDIQNHYEEMDFCSEIKVREIDSNRDSKYDEFNFSITLNNLQEVKIYGVTIILLLDYKLHTECHVQMQTVAMIQHFNNNPGTEISINGEVSFSQKGSIPCSKHRIFSAYNDTVIRKKEFDLKNLFTEEYFTRNISTSVQNTYVAWIAGTGSTFDLNVRLSYPEHKIYFTPQFWQVMKFAWIQYLSVYILFSWFINKLRDYIFTNRLVSYYIDTGSYNKMK